MNSQLSGLSVAQLKEAISLKEKIEGLEKRLTSVLGGTAVPKKSARGTKRTMSSAARAKIGAAQRARWAKKKATKTASAPKPAAKRKRNLSEAARKRISRLTKARWAQVKASGKTQL